MVVPCEDDIDIDVRFSVIPAKEGERVVMRLLAAGPDLGLEQIGLDEEDYNNLVAAIWRLQIKQT